ncbi:hypothetical protein ACFX2I_022870 [Malus domestica]
MQTILENCNNKSSFDGLKHFELLLASMDPDLLASTDLKVFIAALETLSALVKINPSKMHVSGKMVGCGTVNNYLLSLAQKECDGKRMDMANVFCRERMQLSGEDDDDEIIERERGRVFLALQ